MSDGERRQIREEWEALWTLRETWEARCEWLEENEGHPKTAAREAQGVESARAFAAAGDAYAEWLGCSPAVWLALQERVMEYRAARAAEAAEERGG